MVAEKNPVACIFRLNNGGLQLIKLEASKKLFYPCRDKGSQNQSNLTA